jgi:hypothetical protein
MCPESGQCLIMGRQNWCGDLLCERLARERVSE